MRQRQVPGRGQRRNATLLLVRGEAHIRQTLLLAAPQPDRQACRRRAREAQLIHVGSEKVLAPHQAIPGAVVVWRGGVTHAMPALMLRVVIRHEMQGLLAPVDDLDPPLARHGARPGDDTAAADADEALLVGQCQPKRLLLRNGDLAQDIGQHAGWLPIRAGRAVCRRPEQLEAMRRHGARRVLSKLLRQRQVGIDAKR